MKKNNKGFSLVELIVVVLIMAIIAVALAPQVMKWVENSRKSTDCNNYDSVVSAVNIALANEKVMTEISAADVTLTWTAVSSGASWSGFGTELGTAIGNVLGTGWSTDLKVKRTTGDRGPFTITIRKNGTVERTKAPSSDDIS